MKREWPFLALEILFLMVLLQSNAPEVWFWFIALLVLLTWRSLALRSRLEQRRLRADVEAESAPVAKAPPAG